MPVEGMGGDQVDYEIASQRYEGDHYSAKNIPFIPAINRHANHEKIDSKYRNTGYSRA